MEVAGIADFDGSEVTGVNAQGSKVTLNVIGDEARRVVATVPQGDGKIVGDLAAASQDYVSIGDNQTVTLPDGSCTDAALTIINLNQAIEDAVADRGGIVVDLL